jgi:PiT family inorganic phosphate transporter
MVGSIIGVGLANQLMSIHTGTSGVDWEQATKVFKVLLISPIVGFGCAAILLMILKPKLRVFGCSLFALLTALIAHYFFALGILASALTGISVSAFVWFAFLLIPVPPTLFEAPKGSAPPPWPIRLLLVLTCSGVSFAHGSNDGQKGMGLIMLILIGTVPTAYALNHAVSGHDTQAFIAASEQAGRILDQHIDKNGILGEDARAEVTDYIRTKEIKPDTMLALRELVNDLKGDVITYKEYKAVPANQQANVRNDMYVASEAIRLMQKNDDSLKAAGKQPVFNASENATLKTYKSKVDQATKFIPPWVKVAVALALGMGTMVGWKRIVVTVGEKIGKEHLTYAQGACAELVAMCTISAADNFGLPVSTTHVLSSGVAGTMAANGSGLQFSTIRNIAAAWVFTLPAAALLSGSLFWAFRQIAH